MTDSAVLRRNFHHFATVAALAAGLCLPLSPVMSATTIEQSIERAFEQSDSLRAERQAYVETIKSIDVATANENLTGTFVISGADINTDKKTGNTSDKRFTRSLTLSKQLYDFGEVDARVKSAQFSVRAAEASYEAAEQQLMFSVISAHLDVITSAEQLAIRQSNVSRLEAHTDAERIRLENGSSTPTRLAEAEARLARAKSDLISAEAEYATAEDSYSSLTGQMPEDLMAPSRPSALPSEITEAETRARDNHPSLMSRRLAVDIADMQFDILRKSVLPKVKFGMTYSQTDQDGAAMDKDELTTSLEFRTPFLVTQATRGRDVQTMAASKKARLLYDDTLRQVSLNARSAFRDHKAAQAQIDAVMREQEAAELVNKGTATEVEFGLKTILDQLDTEQSVSDANLRMLRSRQAVLTTAYALLLSTGELNAAAFEAEINLPLLDSISVPESRYSLPVPVIVD